MEATPEQPEAAKPIAARMHRVARVASLRQRRPIKPTKSSPTIAMPAWFAWSAKNGVRSFWLVCGAPSGMLRGLTPFPTSAGVGQAEATVLTVKVVATAVVPETVVLGMEKQPFVRAGLLETVQATVPV